ncbi:MAG: hypothetical protein KGQ32_07285 [Xanthomonadaceae bacterium]|nr:hypothetical protein [Xanthomonadaceae bacterium]
MNTRHPVLTALAAGLLAAMSAAALAGSGTSSTESGKLASTYTTFAGSQTNSQALVDGLRNGTPITLETVTPPSSAGGTGTTTATTFQPATGKLGYGNVNIALALARDELAKAGITDPTAAEIQSVLNGGTVVLADGSTQNLQGVLTLRARGEGWGKIAHTLGFKLGDVVSASKTDHSHAGADHSQHGNDMAMANRPVHPDHPAHPDHPQRPDVPHRPDIPDHAGGPGH